MSEIDIPDIAHWNWSIETTFADVQLYFCPVDRAVLKFLNSRIKRKDSRHTHTLDRVLDCRRRNTVILIILD